MKKTLLLFTCILFLSCICFAQDIIVTKDGNKINAIISEIELEIVKYKRFDNQSGPTISISKSDIASIVYQNGGVEVFESILSTQKTQSNSSKMQSNSSSSGSYEINPQYRSAKNLYISGVVISCIGGSLLTAGLFTGLFADMFIGFIILMPVGAGLTIPGAICAGVGGKRMNDIRYNTLYSYQLIKTEKSKLNLNLNTNGVGLALKF